jgi:TRAP-type C4-dicarboxylate transport system substrate-binding protein
MLIRGIQSQTSLIEALGAENISVASTEVLANMEKGTLNGAMGIGTITGYSLYEFCSSAIYLDIMSGFEPQIIMNENSWNKLTAEQHQVVESLFDELSVKIASSFDDWDKAALDFGLENGMTLNTFSDEDLAALQGIAYSLAQEGIEELNALGYDGQSFYDTCRQALQECCDAAGYEITNIE